MSRTDPPGRARGWPRLPWGDAEFSRRVLDDHLDQDHDRASRRSDVIARQVRWLHAEVLGETRGSVLDVGCGPGLHLAGLARLGHRCLGIDVGPAVIEHARATAPPGCRYMCADARSAPLGGPHDLILWLFGEANSFPQAEATALLRRFAGHLTPGGALVVEVHALAALRLHATVGPRTLDAVGGAFADGPHTIRIEATWDPASLQAYHEWHVTTASGDETTYRARNQAYPDPRVLATDAGLEVHSVAVDFSEDHITLVARLPEA